MNATPLIEGKEGRKIDRSKTFNPIRDYNTIGRMITMQCSTLQYSSMPPYEEGNVTDEEVGESVLIEKNS